MREVLRTTDMVRLSWIQALLTESRIRSVVLDSHMSVLEGSANAIPRRLVVEEGDYNAALRVLDEAGELEGKGGRTATDTLLGGRVTLLQPRDGYRAGIDPVLLAAAAPETQRRVLDVGCGVGAAALCYAERVPAAQIVGLEFRPEWAHLAMENARINGFSERVAVHIGSLLNPPSGFFPGSFDQVMANPPYLPIERSDLRADPSSADATVEGDAKLADWIDFCARMAAPTGCVTMIHRADRLDEILSFLRGPAGAIVVFPLWPGGREERARDAKRVIVRARIGSKAPMRLAPGLTLHGAEGDFTWAADQVLRHGKAVTL